MAYRTPGSATRRGARVGHHHLPGPARGGSAWGGDAIHGLTVLVASLVKLILGWMGVTVSQYAALLYVPGGFGYVVAAGCAGVVPAAVMVIAILASPARATARVLGLVVAGMPGLRRDV